MVFFFFLCARNRFQIVYKPKENSYKCKDCKCVAEVNQIEHISVLDHLNVKYRNQNNPMIGYAGEKSLICDVWCQCRCELEPDKCEVLEKMVSHSGTRNRHTQTHTGEKLFDFEVCGKRCIFMEI
ncbi:hypothetical protein CHS0354_003487 [Potamilus streckersoni]|uniref:Uncharacterized protein n=1 Tax=Potamilus streckersoni TaxID=2493646 RepID=A0AAE0SZ17_9BIVA|nr:hypothetical protein CHS0354_003487 [Potamilus streckersoni]